MPKETVLNKEYASLWYYPETKIVHHQFHKFIYGDAFREVLETGLGIFQEEGASKWLSDDRKNSALTSEDGSWSIGDWIPRCMEAGWKYWAVIMPETAVGEVNLRRYVRHVIDLGLTVEVFDDPDEAIAWLESV